jgi:hypothetical protein
MVGWRCTTQLIELLCVALGFGEISSHSDEWDRSLMSTQGSHMKPDASSFVGRGDTAIYMRRPQRQLKGCFDHNAP